MKIRYRLVYCRKGVLRGDGRALVQVEAAQGGRKKYFSTNIYVLPCQWDRRRMEIVGHPNADGLNAYLFGMIVDLEKIELDLWKRGLSPTLDLVKENFVGAREPEVSFRGFWESAVQKSARRVNTKKSLMGTLKVLEMFRPGFSWVDMTLSSLRKFEVWLIGKGFAKNTVVKHLRNLRTLTNEAVVAGYIPYEDNPFRSFRICQQKTPHRYLTQEDLMKLENADVSGRLGHIRDAFLFCCYTGLRFSDFCALRTDFLFCENGSLWIRMELRKTGTEVMIPLDLLFEGKGLEVLKRYETIEEFSRVGSNSRVNAGLKVLQEQAGIRTRLTFHLSRHTCATLLCYQGVPVTTVQKILGHTKVSTTQLYQEVMSETIVNDLQRAQQALSR